MDCQTVQHHFSAYLDHDVPLFTRQLLDEHFARCPQCRGELTQFQTMATWVRSFPTQEPSSTFLQQVCERVEQLPGKPPMPLFRRLVGAIPLQAAAALVVAVSAALLWQMTPSLWHPQEPQHPAPAWVEPWLSQDSAPSPLIAPPPFDPPLEESFQAPAPLVQAPWRRPLFTSYEESGRMARDAAMVPTMAWSPTEARVGEVSFFPSVVLRAADPVQAAQQIWEIVPRMGGSLLQSQGMVTPAERASRGPAKVALTLEPDRYQPLIEAIRQLPDTQVTEERMTFISRGLRPASGGSLWRLDVSQTSMASQMTLVITILPR
jgi:hypothetical protein